MKHLLNYGVFKYLWLIIIVPKTIQFVILGILSVAYLSKSGFLFNKVTISFSAFIFVYLIAILQNVLLNPFVDVMRVFAAVNVVGIWFFAVIAYSHFRKSKIDFLKVKKYMYINMIVMIVLSVVFLFIQYRTNIYILGRPLSSVDWLTTGYTRRFTGFLEYPNLISLFYFIVFPISLLHVLDKKKLYSISFIGLAFIPVIVSNSRITQMAMLFSLLFLSFVHFLTPKQRTFILLQLPFAIIILLILLSNEIGEIWHDFFNLRSGSNRLRFVVYEESLRQVFQRSPFIGLGIRETFAISAHLGTHSTYVGIIFRTGLIGSYFFFRQFFRQLITLIRSLIQSKHVSFLGFIITFLVVIMFEDIDGSNWVLYMLFVFMGIMDNWIIDVKAQTKERIGLVESLSH